MSDTTFSKAQPHPIVASAITRQQSPSNVEYTFAAINSFITPTENFYIRSHFEPPIMDSSAYCLSIEGEVERPFRLSLDEIKAMKRESCHATLECAGNGRVFLVPQVDGAQWELGAVSNARWTGVRLFDVLQVAGLKPSAVEIIFEGADFGMPKEKPLPPEEIHYGHSIPLSKIPDALLAYEMNDQPLTRAHGFPLRVIVPGWYGMASVKWLTRIIASNVDFQGYFRVVDYAYWTELAGHPVRVPIEEMSVKAQISRPAKNEIIPRKIDYLITGTAWTGEGEITSVEVSVDGSQTYSPAKLLGDSIKHAWRLWEFSWRTPDQGTSLTLFARATDSNGRTQPIERNKHLGTYVIHHILPVEVEVK